MPKKLAVLGAVLVLVLATADPALAQNETPACEPHDACLYTSEEAAAEQSTGSPEPDQAFSVAPVPEMECDGDSTNPCSPGEGIPQSGNAQNGVPEAAFDAPASCGSCGLQVAQNARDAITGSGSAGSGGAGSVDAFGAALQAARDTGGTREAAASEETGASAEANAIYRAAFEAAKEAGADDETAKEAAEQAVASAVGSATDKTSKGGASKDRKYGTGSEEEATGDEEAAASGGEDSSSGNSSPEGESATVAPAESRAPLLLGGVALLSVGGYAALGFARSRPSSGVRRLPQD